MQRQQKNAYKSTRSYSSKHYVATVDVVHMSWWKCECWLCSCYPWRWKVLIAILCIPKLKLTPFEFGLIKMLSVLDCSGKSIESSRSTIGHLFEPHCTCQALQNMQDYATHNHWVYSFPVLWSLSLMCMCVIYCLFFTFFFYLSLSWTLCMLGPPERLDIQADGVFLFKIKSIYLPIYLSKSDSVDNS